MGRPLTVLDRARRMRGATLADVARGLGVTPQAVHQWMHGRKPDNHMLAQLLDAIEASPEDRRAVWIEAGVPEGDLR